MWSWQRCTMHRSIGHERLSWARAGEEGMFGGLPHGLEAPETDEGVPGHVRQVRSCCWCLLLLSCHIHGDPLEAGALYCT